MIETGISTHYINNNKVRIAKINKNYFRHILKILRYKRFIPQNFELF